MTDFYEFTKMILSSPPVIILITAVAGLVPLRIQIKRDREKQKIDYDNARRDAHFAGKEKNIL